MHSRHRTLWLVCPFSLGVAKGAAECFDKLSTNGWWSTPITLRSASTGSARTGGGKWLSRCGVLRRAQHERVVVNGYHAAECFDKGFRKPTQHERVVVDSYHVAECFDGLSTNGSWSIPISLRSASIRALGSPLSTNGGWSMATALRSASTGSARTGGGRILSRCGVLRRAQHERVVIKSYHAAECFDKGLRKPTQHERL